MRKKPSSMQGGFSGWLTIRASFPGYPSSLLAKMELASDRALTEPKTRKLCSNLPADLGPLFAKSFGLLTILSASAPIHIPAS
jgi:hypothetical protein